MKPPVDPIGLFALGLLGSAITAVGVTGYLAWDSLRGQPDHAPIALSEAALVTPVAPESPVTASPASAWVTSQPAPVTTPALVPANPTQPATSPAAPPVANPQTTTTWTAQENDYLFDLSHALQPVEYQRLNSAEQLEMARQIQQWIQSGENFWSIRQRFDASYGRALMGDYAHNREVYIRFTTERFAPDYLATLIAPEALPHAEFAPYGAEPQPYPEDTPPYGYWVPEPDLYAVPYPNSNEDPDWPQPRQAPRQIPQPYQQPYRQPYQQPYQPPQPSQIPNIIEASTQGAV